jgi:hypothetical protein
MMPALLTGPVLALAAFVASSASVRVSALLTIGSTGATMLGVIVAAGLDARAHTRRFAVLAVPMVGAVEALRQKAGTAKGMPQRKQ